MDAGILISQNYRLYVPRLFKLILRSAMAYCSAFQVISLLPVYLLQISYGMNTGYPAIITPQLEEPCSEFNITADQESWIGIWSFSK